jgi:hypothetical protein
MRTELIRCDRCKTPLHPANWHSEDEICVECEELIFLALVANKSALMKGVTTQEEIQRLGALYGDRP